MNEHGTVMHVTVIGELDNDKAGGSNHLRSALWRLTNEKPLPNGVTETYERSKAYRKCLEQQIIHHVAAANFHIGANTAGRCPLHIARCIAGRALQLQTPERMRHLLRYIYRITTEMMWMVVERADTLRSGALNFPLPLRKLNKSFSPTSLLK